MNLVTRKLSELFGLALNVNIDIQVREMNKLWFDLAYIGYPLEQYLKSTEATSYKKYEVSRRYTQVIHHRYHLLLVSSPSFD